MLLDDISGGVFSNAPILPGQKLDNAWASKGHCFVDMRDDAFTHGRPHPMMDPSLRISRILAEAKDPETAVVLLLLLKKLLPGILTVDSTREGISSIVDFITGNDHFS